MTTLKHHYKVDNNIPGGLTPESKEHNIPAGSRVHASLLLIYLNGGSIFRNELPGLQYTSRHLAHIMLYGFIKVNKVKRKHLYILTELGHEALDRLQEAVGWSTLTEKLVEEFKVQKAIGTQNQFLHTLFPMVHYVGRSWRPGNRRPIKYHKCRVSVDPKLFDFHQRRVW